MRVCVCVCVCACVLPTSKWLLNASLICSLAWSELCVCVSVCVCVTYLKVVVECEFDL